MSFLLSLIFIFGCLNFENQYSIDRDGDGFSIYDGDCDDNDINITLAECTDNDNDGQNEYEGDCDDENPFVYTGIAYQDDPNKDLCMKDVDGDGFGDKSPPEGIINGSDCDDNRDNVNPTSNEICDELDNDCDEDIDEEPIDGSVFYEDQDGDGFGSNNVSLSVKMCVEQVGYISDNTDCDDSNPQINTDGTEVCDEKDNDCDGLVDGEDEDVDVTTGQMFYVDSDGDGFGDRNNTSYACELYEGLVDNLDDCDDENEDISPNGVEVCDGVDNDCDNKIDDNDTVVGGEGSGLSIFYRDVDNDGYGNADLMIERCVGIDGYVTDNTDCDDTKFNVNLGRSEICDGIDNDCDELIDDSDDSVSETTTFYRDVDGDGFGNGEITEEKCVASEGFVEDSSDCEDGNGEIHPNASEVCDEIDNDCDDLVDDDDNSVDVSIGGVPFYFDFDGDGVGVEDISEVRCSAKDRFVADYGDCDDSEETVFVGAEELCDGLNNDCSENGDLTSLPFDEIDNDGDGFVECEVVEWKGSNTPLGGGDCDDEDPLTFVGSAELDSEILCMRDADGDGFGDETSSVGVESGSDCDDGNDSIYPNAEELCDGLKNDCLSEQMSNDELDLDGDGFVVCDGSDWVGSEIGFDDCNDGDGSVYPNAEEFCDGIVTDCRSQWYGTGNVRYVERDIDGDGSVACEIVESGWLGEGNPISGDCDDSDPLSTAKEFDADCDGILTEEDCDDNNALDNDCDGVAIEDDCDDSDPNSTIKSEDNDCDGIEAEDDCSDDLPNDADCDGVPTEEDCDDSNIEKGSNVLDTDCDGILAEEDCNDEEHSDFTNLVDTDCDGEWNLSLGIGNYHSCTMRIDGSVVCWETGDLTYFNYEQVSTTPEVKMLKVKSGYYHNCGINTDSTITCWGAGKTDADYFPNYGQSIAPSGTFIDLDARAYTTCAISIDNQVVCWGQEYSTTLPTDKFSSITMSDDYMCGLLKNNTIKCWGSNEAVSTHPTSTFLQIDAGSQHACGIREDKTLECWGSNNYGVSTPPSGQFHLIASGNDFSCALDLQKQIQCWGNDNGGMLPSNGTFFKHIEIDETALCGIQVDDSIQCWGSDSNENQDDDAYPIRRDCDDNVVTNFDLLDDSDCDGIPYDLDCDDSLFSTISKVQDDNCDGIVCVENQDPTDMDCDGIGVEEDCDDGNNVLGDIATDSDCDGILTSDDCDDQNPSLGSVMGDEDCDGIWNAQIGVGNYHTCGIKSDGKVSCWGVSDGSMLDYGQVRNTPDEHFVQIAVGEYHSCGVSITGQILCWGAGESEEVGSIHVGQSNPPYGNNYKLVRVHEKASCALTQNGYITCWGDYPQIEDSTMQFKDISLGDGFICGIKATDEVFCWGAGEVEGNCDYPDFDRDCGQSIPPTESFLSIASSKNHSCGRTTSGDILCWGDNSFSQSSPPSGTFLEVDVSEYYSCGLREDLSIDCWGNMAYGQISAPLGEDFITFDVGNKQTCGITTNNEALCWGANYYDYGENQTDFDMDTINVLQDCNDRQYNSFDIQEDNDCDDIHRDSDCDDNNILQVSVAIDPECDGLYCNDGSSPQEDDLDCDGITATEDCDDLDAELQSRDSDRNCDGIKERIISSGYSTTCLIDDAQETQCWANENFAISYEEDEPLNETFVSIATGSFHSCGLLENGEVQCWGAGLSNSQVEYEYGQSIAPQNISFVQITAGGTHTCGIDRNGFAHCWGANYAGQTNVPPFQFQEVRAAESHTCGLTLNGDIQCWGSTYYYHPIPTYETYVDMEVGWYNTCGLTNAGIIQCWDSYMYQSTDSSHGFFVELTAGAGHFCGIKEDRTVTCFDYYSMEVWDNTPTDTFVQIDAGVVGHTCGVTTDGKVICWGNYSYNPPYEIDEDSDLVGVYVDCDDGYYNPNDKDCDGILTGEDCDDLDATTIFSNTEDLDCDNIHNDLDCEPNNAVDSTNLLLDTNCDTTGIIEVDYSDSLLCFTNDQKQLFCQRNPEQQVGSENTGSIYIGMGFDEIDVYEDKVCALNENNQATCWNAYGKILIENQYSFDDIIVGTESFCGTYNTAVDCHYFEPKKNPAKHPLGSIEDVFIGSANQGDVFCGYRQDRSLICWSLEAEIPFAQIEEQELSIDCSFEHLQGIYCQKNGTRIDTDNDGIYWPEDCNDNHDQIFIRTEDDLDCDGINASDDCDDTIPSQSAFVDGIDCEQLLCENGMFSSSDDQDCDGIDATEDCDDLNEDVGSIYDDYDCDGVLNFDDCNNFGDVDCDGVIYMIDCDDNNPLVGDIGIDNDCDGIVSMMDCDDNDEEMGWDPTQCSLEVGNQIAMGSNHSCVLTTQNTISCIGDGTPDQNPDYILNYGQSTPPKGFFVSIHSSYDHNCAIREDGKVYCWGLGETNDNCDPFFNDECGQSIPPEGTFFQVTTGRYHSCGIDMHGFVECWGRNDYGESSPPSGQFIDISAGVNHTCGITSSGSILCWGISGSQVNNTPTGLFSQIESGDDYSCALDLYGMTVCWGELDHMYSMDAYTGLAASSSLTCGNAPDEYGSRIDCWGTTWGSSNANYIGDYSEIDISGSTLCAINSDDRLICSTSGTEFNEVDADLDGSNIRFDCNDNDDQLGSWLNDNDCDGVISHQDCDDNSIFKFSSNLDSDCDGILNNNDCDPYNGNDDDCDGIINEEDLYPNNPYICLIPNDFDCDGFDIDEDCDDSDVRFGSIENDTDCDGLTNGIDPDPNFPDGDLDGISYDEDCDDQMSNASQYDENGNCTLAICLNENNEEVPTEGIVKTDIIYGEATITLTSYEGWEQHQFAEGLSYGERNCYLDWDITGVPNVNPVGCEDCIFTFELTRTSNPFGNERVPSNVDMNDGTCTFFETWQESPPPFSYGYAEDYNGYGPALFYDGGDGFYPWIVPSQTEYPDESSLLYDETTGHFSYSIGFEDYLYSPCE